MLFLNHSTNDSAESFEKSKTACRAASRKASRRLQVSLTDASGAAAYSGGLVVRLLDVDTQAEDAGTLENEARK
jgi:hypothetical protein